MSSFKASIFRESKLDEEKGTEEHDQTTYFVRQGKPFEKKGSCLFTEHRRLNTHLDNTIL